ncbi:hypothetical protein AB8A21_41495, partial [Streptomyces sp. BF23-18]
ALTDAAREAFTHGMQAAAVAGAVLLLGAAALAAASLRTVAVRESGDVLDAGTGEPLPAASEQSNGLTPA